MRHCRVFGETASTLGEDGVHLLTCKRSLDKTQCTPSFVPFVLYFASWVRNIVPPPLTVCTALMPVFPQSNIISDLLCEQLPVSSQPSLLASLDYFQIPIYKYM